MRITSDRLSVLVASSILWAGAILAGVSATAAETTLALSKTYRWKMTSFFPGGHPHNKALHEFVEALDRRTGGGVKVTIYESTLGAPGDHWDMLKGNAVQLAFLAEGYAGNKMPVASLANLPFETVDMNTLMDVFNGWMRAGYLKEVTDNFHVLFYKPTPYQSLVTARKKVTSLADFKGLKIRALGGLQGQAITALGASGVSMPGSEIYMALQTHVVDGTITGPDFVLATKLYEPCKYALRVPVYSGMWVAAMNKETWEGLPKELQALIDEVGREIGAADFKRQVEGERTIWDSVRKAGVEVYTIPAEERARWKAATADVAERYVREWAGKGAPVKEALEMMRRLAARQESGGR